MCKAHVQAARLQRVYRYRIAPFGTIVARHGCIMVCFVLLKKRTSLREAQAHSELHTKLDRLRKARQDAES